MAYTSRAYTRAVPMSYRDYEKAALRKLAEIDSSGDFVTRQKILAARAWLKKTTKGESGKSLYEEEMEMSHLTDEERLLMLIESMEERHRREVRELQIAIHDLRLKLGDNSKFGDVRVNFKFSEVTDDTDAIEVDWDEDYARLARTMEARHAEEMAVLEAELLEIQHNAYRK